MAFTNSLSGKVWEVPLRSLSQFHNMSYDHREEGRVHLNVKAVYKCSGAVWNAQRHAFQP